MRKKRFITVIGTVAITAGLLSSCGTTGTNEETASVVTSETTSAESEKEESGYIDLDELVWNEGDTEAMSNQMQETRLYIDGTWIYGIDFDDNGDGNFSKEKIDGTEKTKLSDKPAYNIMSEGGWIYFVGAPHGTTDYSLNRVRMSGEDEKVLVKQPEGYLMDYVFLHNDRFYYVFEKEKKDGTYDCKLHSCDLNGKNDRVILKKATFYPYIVGDKIVYQDDVDYAKLHCCDLDGSNDVRISDDCVYRYVFDGKHIYYQTDEVKPEFDKNHHPKAKKGAKNVIKRMDVDGSNVRTVVKNATVFVMNDSRIFYLDDSDDGRLYSCDKNGEDIQLLSQEKQLSNLAIYGNYITFINYDSNYEYIDSVQMCELDGTNVHDLFTGTD